MSQEHEATPGGFHVINFINHNFDAITTSGASDAKSLYESLKKELDVAIIERALSEREIAQRFTREDIREVIRHALNAPEWVARFDASGLEALRGVHESLCEYIERKLKEQKDEQGES